MAARFASGSQGNIESLCGYFGIVVKKLVKITHAIKQQLMGVVAFNGQVLLHHRCMWGGF